MIFIPLLASYPPARLAFAGARAAPCPPMSLRPAPPPSLDVTDAGGPEWPYSSPAGPGERVAYTSASHPSVQALENPLSLRSRPRRSLFQASPQPQGEGGHAVVPGPVSAMHGPTEAPVRPTNGLQFGATVYSSPPSALHTRSSTGSAPAVPSLGSLSTAAAFSSASSSAFPSSSHRDDSDRRRIAPLSELSLPPHRTHPRPTVLASPAAPPRPSASPTPTSSLPPFAGSSPGFPSSREAAGFWLQVLGFRDATDLYLALLRDPRSAEAFLGFPAALPGIDLEVRAPRARFSLSLTLSFALSPSHRALLPCFGFAHPLLSFPFLSSRLLLPPQTWFDRPAPVRATSSSASLTSAVHHQLQNPTLPEPHVRPPLSLFLVSAVPDS